MLQFLGYCPQRIQLPYNMTVREVLVLYAHLRGLDPRIIQDITDKLLVNLDLIQQAGKNIVHLR